MIVQSFRSVMWVGAVAGAAIGCYMVSLRVASERARLETVETRILLAKRDIRALDTELSTRGRVRQLEQWNADVLALAPPGEGQFLEGEVQLASLPASTPSDEVTTPVRMAAASVKEGGRTVTADYRTGDSPANSLLVRASAAAKPRAQARAAVLKKPAKLAAALNDKVTVKTKSTAKTKTGKKSAARDKAPSPSKKLAAGDKAPAGKKVKADKAL